MRIGHHFMNWDIGWKDDLDRRLEFTRELGYEGFETKPNLIPCAPEELARRCAARGLEAAAIGPAGGPKETIDYACAAGAGIVRCGVPVEACARWVEYAAERGIMISMHPHIAPDRRGKGAVETREDLLRYLDERPGVFGCPDTGHLLLCGSDPVRTIRDLGERCGYVHLKDLDPSKAGTFEKGGASFWELGTGCLDPRGVMDALAEVGYDGWIMVERDRRVPDPVRSARNMRAALRGMGF